MPQSHQPVRQPYTVNHDFDGAAKLSTTLVHALSTVTNADMTDTEFTLHDYVDPDALNRLFRSQDDADRINGHLTFTIMGYQTTIYSNGQIRIVPLEVPPQPQ